MNFKVGETVVCKNTQGRTWVGYTTGTPSGCRLKDGGERTITIIRPSDNGLFFSCCCGRFHDADCFEKKKSNLAMIFIKMDDKKLKEEREHLILLN